MRILTFNVNSLHRLLNHPLHHILKGQAKAAAAAAQAEASRAGGPETTNHEVNMQPAEEAAAAAARDVDGGSGSTELDLSYLDDDRFAWMDDPDLTSSLAESTASTDAAAASPVAAVASSGATSTIAVKAQQPRSQSEIDALAATQQAEWREFNAHATATAVGALLSGTLSTRLSALLAGLQADIICFQEVKMARGRLPEHMAVVDGWHAFFSFSRKRQGYSGVVTYVRKTATPVKAEEGFTGMLAANSSAHHPPATVTPTSIGEFASMYAELDPATLKALDSEGRCVVTDHEKFVLFNFYMPNAPSPTKENPDDTSRLEFKMLFYKALQLRAQALVRAGRHVIIVGDVNACHKPIDHCDYAGGAPPPQSIGTERAPFENANREWLGKFLVDGGGLFVDVFRRFHPERTKAYTCWNTKTGARLSNYGARIDYILASVDLYESGFFTRCDIRPDIHCSDHCPVEADINVDSLCHDANRVPPPLCSRFMPEFSGAQQNIEAFFTKGAPPPPSTSASTPAAAAMQDVSPSISLSRPSAPPSSSLKRPRSLPSPITQQPSKAQKLNTGKRSAMLTAQPNKHTVSLHSFFGASNTPKVSRAASTTDGVKSGGAAARAEMAVVDLSSPVLPMASPATMASAYEATNSPTPSAAAAFATSPTPTSSAAAAAAGVDPAAAWKNLLNQKSEEMKCKKHSLRCKLLTVGKPGVNHGREFYICALVPPERCDFFEWKTNKKS